jgi:acyl dehydratase
MLYFEHFSPGDRWELPEVVLNAEEIVAFARQWDPQPYHVDPVAAAASGFGGLVASGMHTLLVLVRAQHDAVLGHTAAAAGIGIDLQFRAPVRPGRPFHGHIQVADTRPHPFTGRPWGLVVFEIVLESAESTLLTAENRVLVWRGAEDIAA